MNPVDCPRDACRDGVCHFNQFRGILGLFEVLVPSITVAEVITQLDTGWDTITKPDKMLEDSCLDVSEECRHLYFQTAKLDRYIPLNSQFVLWNGGCDPVKLVKHPGLVSWLDCRLVSRHNKCDDWRKRRWKTDLEAKMRRNNPCLFELREQSVRCCGRVSIAKLIKLNVPSIHRGTELEARLRGVGIGIRGDVFKTGIVRENRGLPAYPVNANAGFAVGNASQSFAQNRSGGAEDFLRVCQRNTADQVYTTGLRECRFGGILVSHSFLRSNNLHVKKMKGTTKQ